LHKAFQSEVEEPVLSGLDGEFDLWLNLEGMQHDVGVFLLFDEAFGQLELQVRLQDLDFEEIVIARAEELANDLPVDLL